VLTIALISVVTSFFLVALQLVLARRFQLLDHPDARSSHIQPTPTGAGLALVLGLSLSLALAGGLALIRPQALLLSISLALLLPAIVLSMVGFLDDRRGVPALQRLLVQVLAASWLIWCLRSPLGMVLGDLLLVPLTGLVLIWLVWNMNAYNFMDGSNGMAAMQGILTGTTLAIILTLNGAGALALVSAAVAGVCLGFLPWNAPKARIFMGDAGSVPLGFLLSGLLLIGWLDGALPLPVVLLLLLPFQVDAGLTLLSRIRNKRQWYTAHKEHAYQKLMSQGWSHARVLLLYTAINVLIVMPGAVLGALREDLAWWLFFGAAFVLAIAWYATSSRQGVSR